MSTAELQREIEGFFDGFVRAFLSFSGASIAALYLGPCVFLTRDGAIECLQTRAEMERYFQAAIDEYRAQGCRDIRFTELEVVPIGGRSALGTVTWQLLRDDGGVVRQWRQSYNLYRGDDGLHIYCSTQHIG